MYGMQEVNRKWCYKYTYHSVAQEPGAALENSWLSKNDRNVGRPSGLKVWFADG